MPEGNDGLIETYSPTKDPDQRFAQNLVAETATIIIAIILGLATSTLIVRGLPKTPIYEFYVYILVFTWVGILLPICVVGLDIVLMKHIPEILNRRSMALQRVVGWTITTTLTVSTLLVIGIWVLLLWLPPGLLLSQEVVPYLQLALFTLPLNALSLTFQGVYRGLQEMRFCTYAMGFYHGLYFTSLITLYFIGSFTLVMVIWANIAVASLTIILEIFILAKLLRQYGQFRILSDFDPVSRVTLTKTALQAFLLALLGAIFLYIPLLIANQFRTSDVLLAGLGLAVNIAVYIQRGQAAPFRVLLPHASGDLIRGDLHHVEGYVNRALKLGTLFNGFSVVIAFFFAAPVLSLLFGFEGFVALPFFMLICGSFLIYPLASTMMDTLIGLGGIREVLLTYTGWTGAICVTLLLLCPIWQEYVVTLIWLVGIPFMVLFLFLYKQRTKLNLEGGFIPRGVGILGLITLFSASIIWSGMGIIFELGLSNLFLIGIQILLIITIFPLFLLYLLFLSKAGVFVQQDLDALIDISRVLHPFSTSVTWLLTRLKATIPKEKPPDEGKG